MVKFKPKLLLLHYYSEKSMLPVVMVRESGLGKTIPCAAGGENNLISLPVGGKTQTELNCQVGRQMPSAVVIRQV